MIISRHFLHIYLQRSYSLSLFLRLCRSIPLPISHSISHSLSPSLSLPFLLLPPPLSFLSISPCHPFPLLLPVFLFIIHFLTLLHSLTLHHSPPLFLTPFSCSLSSLLPSTCLSLPLSPCLFHSLCLFSFGANTSAKHAYTPSKLV